MLDRDGNELVPGSQVEFVPGAESLGEIKGPRFSEFSGWALEVYWRTDPDGERIVIPHNTRPKPATNNTYRCPNLRLCASDQLLKDSGLANKEQERPNG
jgi:hypothetical protein